MKNNSTEVNTPLSTYRIQLHQDFTLKDLEQRIDYLHGLGVSAIYAAPLFKAASGSTHGYDVTDYHTINPEIGDLNDLKRVSARLKDRGMLWVQDIVPNHMAFAPQNERLMDVLERGEHSDYASFFDIHWDHSSPDLKGKLMVPFLGKGLEECIDNDELKLVFDERGFEIAYYENRYPLSVSAYRFFLKESIAISGEDGLDDLLELASEAQYESFVQWKQIKSSRIEGIKKDEKKLNLVYDVLIAINADRAKLGKILRHQYYTLTYWKRTEKEINYRRFFTINSLICLCMENEKVFNDYHSFLYKLYEQNLIDGLRIDHIDGLHNPNDYLKRLRQLFGNKCYIVTEKILEATEDMPANWPVQGDSGYQFLAQVSQLLTNRQGGQELLKFYRQMIPGSMDYQQLVLNNKERILNQYMSGEWDNLTRLFFDLRLQNNYAYTQIKQALSGFMLCLPVYRIYPEKLPVTGSDKIVVEEAFEKAFRIFADCRNELEYLLKLFTTSSGSRAYKFINRLMQFTGPLTAKGVEDTTFYVHNAHISHCEVGDSPSVSGIAAQEFHDQMVKKSGLMPRGLNATATHDTKRGEDARIRINVLSEIPAEWENHVRRWMEMNKPFKKGIKRRTAPTLNDEYFIYQAITGGFPDDMQVNDEFVRRLQEYIIKVVREAKVNSNWEAPDEEYEGACTAFVREILKAEHTFLTSFEPFLEKIMQYARVYTLAQTLIKVTVPGVPDIYQGCELWDLSFVDPDNRRPVDYQKRTRFLDLLNLHENEMINGLATHLSSFRSEGMDKMYIIRKMLHFRKKYPNLFIRGDYQPLLVTRKGVVLAFIRRLEDVSVLVAVPIGLSLYDASRQDSAQEDVDIVLPESARGQWENILTGGQVYGKDRLAVHEVLHDFPVAVLLKAS